MLAGELEEPSARSVLTREDLRRSNAQWILKVGETRRLSRAATVGIVQDVADLVGDLVLGLKHELYRVLFSNGVNPSSLDGLSELFRPTSLYPSPFEGLTTFHQQLQQFKLNFDFVVCGLCYTCTFTIHVYKVWFTCVQYLKVIIMRLATRSI